MSIRHFFKTFIMFTGMILIGLLGVFLVSYYGNNDNTDNISADVAK